MKLLTDVITKSGRYFTLELPAKRVVCPACDGCGTELRGGLKGAVFTEDDMIEAGDEFREDYMNGAYDVACSHCKGRNVVLVVDESQLTAKMRERYYRAIDARNAADAEDAAERRWFGQE